MKEIWKPIEGYEGKYMVSNTGKVKSLNYRRTGKEGILKGRINDKGYLRVELCKDGRKKWYMIHRLVAHAFLENSQNLPVVNHKDENKQNNCVQNLEWCSVSYNNTYGVRIGKVTEKLRGRKQSEECIKKLSKPVFSIDKESGLIMWWQSAKEAGRITGIDQGSITRCCQGKYKSAGGNIWFYADDDEDE